MRIYTLLSQKGGAGKSTLARHLAVLAAEDGPSYILDRDPQGTCRRWLDRRGEGEDAPERPELLDIGTTPLTKAVAKLRTTAGALFIDTRPQVAEPEAEAARAADVVIVPVRPSPDDLEAVGDTLAMLHRLSITPLVVVNAARSAGRALAARAALSQHGVRVCPHHLTDRTVYLDAALEGRALAEMRGAAAASAATEIRSVWTWIQESTRG
jgi:chromosome partitioning protein